MKKTFIKKLKRFFFINKISIIAWGFVMLAIIFVKSLVIYTHNTIEYVVIDIFSLIIVYGIILLIIRLLQHYAVKQWKLLQTDYISFGICNEIEFAIDSQIQNVTLQLYISWILKQDMKFDALYYMDKKTQKLGSWYFGHHSNYEFNRNRICYIKAKQEGFAINPKWFIYQ